MHIAASKGNSSENQTPNANPKSKKFLCPNGATVADCLSQIFEARCQSLNSLRVPRENSSPWKPSLCDAQSTCLPTPTRVNLGTKQTSSASYHGTGAMIIGRSIEHGTVKPGRVMCIGLEQVRIRSHWPIRFTGRLIGIKRHVWILME